MKTIFNPRPVEILLVEDNPGDVRLTLEALKDGKVLNNLNVVGDGVEALAYLHKEGNYASAVTPDIILLDINLPRKNGREILAEIKVDERLKRIPVVVLSTSRAEEDIIKSYNLHANCYISKPIDIHQFVKVVQAIDYFWFNIVTLPPENER
jgi:two-component system, chemotaxis family, response regulator Rcp1